MQDFSNHVIALANREGKGISNLELQKVMYFAIGSYIKANGIDDLIKSIYDEPFEAWPYGPVVRSVYFKHKLRGRNRIKVSGNYYEYLSSLNENIKEYLDVPIRKMVNDSHNHPVWKDNIKKIMKHEKVLYSLEDIRDAFVN